MTARVRARSRGAVADPSQPTLPGMEDLHAPGSIAERVAQRYARLPSYRDVLAPQVAALGASIDLPPETASTPLSSSAVESPETLPATAGLRPSTVAPAPEPRQPDLLRYTVSSDSLPERRTTPAQARAEHLPPIPEPGPAPHFLDPLEEALVEPTRPLPATLLASPRELVAPWKARPRLAEGPLRVDSAPSFDRQDPAVAPEPSPVSNSPAGTLELPGDEIVPETRSSMPNRATPPPEWLSIQLDTEPRPNDPKSSSLSDGPRLHVASLQDRALAALFDCGLTLCAFLLFSAVFAICSTSLPRGRAALLGACAALFAMGLLYQLLFFSLADATPGMRYAKIALCTFDDENPTRSALRGRIAALLLSALPLGLGFLWAVFDEDSLGWHDRITQTYQRSYRET